MSTPLANLHGKILPLDEVQVPALDRGFLFGDAVYEVLRVYRGKPFLEAEHFARLGRSLKSIGIEGVDVERLRRRMHETLKAAGTPEATVYLQVTRGSAPRKHAFPKNATPLELLWVQAFEDHWAEVRRNGARVVTHPDLRWKRCEIKSTNLLANVLANQKAVSDGAIEALLYLPDDTVTEASHSSYFAVQGGALLTSPLAANILPGITRGLVVGLAERAGIPLREQNLRRADLAAVDELFLTGTTFEIVPATRVDDAPVGAGTPGPVTQRLQAVYADVVREA